MDRKAIQQRIPHRPPMLLVDRVTVLDEGVRGVGTFTIRPDSPFLEGHFPGDPIFPGCMILEAMAQMVAIVLRVDGSGPRYLAKVDKLKFLKPVRPGDDLELEAQIDICWQTMVKATTRARVRGEIVASAEITAA